MYKTNFNIDSIEYEGSLYNAAEWLNGTSFLPKDTTKISKEGIPIIKIRELKQEINKNTEYYKGNLKNEFKINKGDLLYSWSGSPETSLDAYFFNLERGILNQHIFKITTKQFVSKDYFFYLLNFLKPILVRIANDKKTTGLGHITIQDLKNLTIQIPKKKSQDLTVNILKSIDDKIKFNKKTNQTLEKIAKTLFKSWFVDFDPVRSKLEGVPTGLSKEINDLFPDSFEDSELGEMPKGWKITKLRNIIDIFGGQAFKSKDYTFEGIFVLRTKNFDDGIVKKDSNDVFLPKTFLDSYKDFVCEPFDYHLVMVGASIGKTGMIFPYLLPALRNQNMWCFRPRDKEVISKFYTKFVVDVVSKKLMGFASGSARDFFKRDDFKDHQLFLPPKQILKVFAEITNPMLEKISINYEEILMLSKLRDALLPKLISGELKIFDAEKFTEQVSA